MRGGPFSCASSPAELWPLSNLPGKVFDSVCCTHHTYYLSKDFSSTVNFQSFFAQFFVFHYFSTFSPHIGMRSLPNI